MNRFRLSALVATVSLAACTTNPYTGEQQASKAATYGAGAAADVTCWGLRVGVGVGGRGVSVGTGVSVAGGGVLVTTTT